MNNAQGSVCRSTLAAAFDLDEKLQYKELIEQALSQQSKLRSSPKPLDITKPIRNLSLIRTLKKFDDTDFLKFRNKSDKEVVISSDSDVEVVPSESSSASSRIEPVNTLREYFRDNNKEVAESSWLAQLQSKYSERAQNQRGQLKERTRQSDIITKVIGEQDLALVQHKLKSVLSLPEACLQEPVEEPRLPPLSLAQEKLIERALGPGPSGQVFAEKFNLKILRRDLQTLAGTNWLNDEVINFYMNLLMQRAEERQDLPRIYATNTFFYPKLMQSGHAGLKRWTRKVDIFSHELMAVPVHLGVHWCMALIFFRDKKIHYLDSMGGRNQECLRALLQYLRDEHLDKKGSALDDAGWTMECLKDIPQQMNGSDCGMFACTFAEFSSRRAPYSFSQKHMPYLRRKAALEIIQGRLLL